MHCQRQRPARLPPLRSGLHRQSEGLPSAASLREGAAEAEGLAGAALRRSQGAPWLAPVPVARPAQGQYRGPDDRCRTESEAAAQPSGHRPVADPCLPCPSPQVALIAADCDSIPGPVGTLQLESLQRADSSTASNVMRRVQVWLHLAPALGPVQGVQPLTANDCYECLHDPAVKLLAGAAVQLLERLLQGDDALVGAVGGHRVEGVADEDDARA